MNVMRKLRVYIETSVWSHVFADDAPGYRADTLAFFNMARRGGIEGFVAQTVLAEFERADSERQSELVSLLDEIRPIVLPVNTQVVALAREFIRAGAVPPSKGEDAEHAAAAFVHELDVLVSWNFRHIVNVRRSQKFNAVAALAGYNKTLKIVSPSELLYVDEDQTD